MKKHCIKKYYLFFACLFILSAFAAQYTIAGVYFIEKNDEPGGTQLGRCIDRGYTKTENCNDPYKKGETCFENTRYHKGCVCKPDYKFTKKYCEDKGLTPKGTPCRENNEDKYKECDCGTDYKFDENNCKAPKVLSKSTADMCGGKSRVCSCPAEYKYDCKGLGQQGVDGCDSGKGIKYKSCKCIAPTDKKCKDNGPAINAKTCTDTNNEKWYDTCKPNEPDTCEDSSLVSEGKIKSGETCKYVSTLNAGTSNEVKCYNGCKETCLFYNSINSKTYWNGKLGYFMNINDPKYRAPSPAPSYCIKLAECSEFGFKSNVNCSGKDTVLCAFDNNYKFCPDKAGFK